MKKIVVLFFILLKVNAQYCKVVYNVVPTYGTIEQPSNVSAENQKFVQNMVAGADETLKTMFYNLVVNNKISIFEIEKLKLKSNPNYYAMISATNDVFYTTNDTLYRLTNKSGSKVAIILNPRNNWILENESKTINSYKCFKAHIEVPWRYGSTNGGRPSYKVTAWYCPEIPFKFGPKCFSGLPGLVLELQDNKVIFQAISIVFSDVPIIKNEYLKNHTKITENKYFTQVSEMVKSMNFSK